MAAGMGRTEEIGRGGVTATGATPVVAGFALTVPCAACASGRFGCRGAIGGAAAGRTAGAGFPLGAAAFTPGLGFACGATFVTAGRFAAGLAATALPATGFLASGFFAGGFFGATFLATAFFAAGFAGFTFFFPGAGAAFFAGLAAVLRTGFAEPRAFAPCFPLLPELFTVLGATRSLLATALQKGFKSYFNVAR
ncbi:MAG: hypothetical protein ABIV06_02070 [Thermoanaerobaculia bacterium]